MHQDNWKSLSESEIDRSGTKGSLILQSLQELGIIIMRYDGSDTTQIGQPSDYWGVILNGLYTSIFEGQVVYNQVIVDWVSDPNLGLNPNSLSIEEWIANEMQHYTNVIQNNEDGYILNFDCQ